MSISTSSSYLKMFAHRADGCTEKTEHSKKIEIIYKLLNQNIDNQNRADPSDRSVVFCESDSSARRVTLSLVRKYKTCILTGDMFDASQFAANKERASFNNDSERIAVCSIDAFERSQLPLIQHYIFFEIPKAKLEAYGNIISILDTESSAEKRVVSIDTIATDVENEMPIKALIMEMESRRSELPQWLQDFDQLAIRPTAAPVAAPRPQFVMTVKNSTRDAPTASPVAALVAAPVSAPPSEISAPLFKKATQPESFDAANLQRNAQNKFVVPAGCVMGWDDDDDDDEMFHEEANEHEYNYENFDSYEDYEAEYDYRN